ncbi:MAG TPA: hypothetical protein PLU24_05715, partial [Candidatus Omnitrophota bacterium]|nr:hypothetical protein [Candidatus Omnitrophota bacterium]
MKKTVEIKNQDPLTALEFNETTIRICRSITRRSRRVITHCFSFETSDFEKDAEVLIAKELREN